MKIKQRLYSLTHRAEIAEEQSCKLHVQVFFIVQGYPPIPLTLVIDPAKKTLVTLYISSGWEKDESSGQTVWRWRS